MLGSHAKINGGRAKRRRAFCSAGPLAQHLRLQREARRPRRQTDRPDERQSLAGLLAKTGQRSATGASQNVSVRTGLDPLFSSTYRFFNCTLVSVRIRPAAPHRDFQQTVAATRPNGSACRAAISNRYTNLLETIVTRRKQKTPPTSNRYKSRLGKYPLTTSRDSATIIPL